MEASNPYRGFTATGPRALTPWAGAFLRRQVPYVWNAAAVDRFLLKLATAFFLTGERPHYRDLPKAWAVSGGIYTSPALRATPAAFFRPVAMPVGGVKTRRLNKLSGGERLGLSFVSSYQTYDPAYQTDYSAFAGNEVFQGRLWRHAGAARPTVICIHGWLGGHLWLEEQIFAASELYASGVNVAIVTLPFHGARKPSGKHGYNLFPSSDMRRTNEAFGQIVADLDVLMRWLRASGAADRIGLVGFSLGGYVAALMAGLDASLDFVVPVIAPSSLADLVWNLGIDGAGKRAAGAAGFAIETFRASHAVHCPLSYDLKLPKERVLLIAGRADHVVPPDQVLALWEHWQQPEIVWFPGGHYVHFGRQSYLRRIHALIAAGGHAAVAPAARPFSPIKALLGRRFKPLAWLRRLWLRAPSF